MKALEGKLDQTGKMLTSKDPTALTVRHSSTACKAWHCFSQTSTVNFIQTTGAVKEDALPDSVQPLRRLEADLLRGKGEALKLTGNLKERGLLLEVIGAVTF